MFGFPENKTGSRRRNGLLQLLLAQFFKSRPRFTVKRIDALLTHVVVLS
jgi:hypothetical protein